MSEPDFSNAPEVILAEDRRVSCDGGGGALGHPLTFYQIGDEDYVVCKYCDRAYILAGGKHDLKSQA